MPAPTVAVTVKLFAQDGSAYAGVRVTAKLDKNEIYQGFVISDEVTAATNSLGVAVLNLFPNHPATGLGTTGSVYTFKASPPGGKTWRAVAQIPNSACNLEAVANIELAPGLNDAQAALAAAQGFNAQSSTSAGVATDAATAANASKLAAASSASSAGSSASSATLSASSASASATAAQTSGSAVALRNDLAASTGSTIPGHTSPTGLVTTTQAAIRAFQPRNGPLLNQKFELVNDASPLNYVGTRAIGVIQHRDTANAVLNDLIPGFVSQFTVSGSGFVNAATEYSGTIWLGDFSSMSKTGDGSAHCYSGIGNLGAVGPGGYNELGAFQAELTNNGSVLGNISGFEVYIKDSPDQGTTTYSTRMAGHVSRIAKFNPTTRPAFSFFASSEGTQNINGIIGVNFGGGKFQRGFDFTNAIFSTGQFGLVPNNTALAWLTSTSVAQPILGMSANDTTFLRPGSAATSIDLQDFAGTTRLQIKGSGGLIAFLNATLSAGATAGVNGPPPAQVSGYMTVIINGATAKLPYYNA